MRTALLIRYISVQLKLYARFMNNSIRAARPFLLLVAVGLLVGCGSEATPEVTPAPEAAEVATAPEPEESESPEPTEEPEPAPTPEDVTGSRASPMKIGDMRQISTGSAFTVGITEVNLDATDAIMAAEPWGDPPPEGERYITATLEVAVSEAELAAQGVDLQEEGAEPYMSIYVEFVSADGRGYDALDSMCWAQDAFSETGTVYADGATVSGVECLSVPDDEVEGGLWRLSNSIDEAVWIEASE